MSAMAAPTTVPTGPRAPRPGIHLVDTPPSRHERAVSRADDDRPILLTVRALGIGDLVATVPALRALRQAYPDHRHVLATDARLGPLAAASGTVDEIVDVRAGRDPRRLAVLARTMAGRQADVVANLHSRGPESHRAAKALRPRRILAFGRYELGVAGPPWLPYEHEVDRWLRLVGTTTGSLGSHDDCLLPRFVSSQRAPIVIVHPGASTTSRCWPAHRFGWLASSLQAVGYHVVVTGSAAERDLAESVVQQAGLPPAANLAGRTSVGDLAALVGNSRLVVSGDSGPAHLAWATHTPSVRLHGPTDSRPWAPRTGPHTLVIAPSRHLVDLTRDEVLEACLDRLDQSAAEPGDGTAPAVQSQPA